MIFRQPWCSMTYQGHGRHLPAHRRDDLIIDMSMRAGCCRTTDQSRHLTDSSTNYVSVVLFVNDTIKHNNNLMDNPMDSLFKLNITKHRHTHLIRQ